MTVATVPLGELADVVSGGTPKRSEPSYFGGDIPWVKIGDMLQGTVASTEESITSAGLAGSSAKLLPAGTLLLSIFATIGRTAVLGVDAATNQAVAGLMIRDSSSVDRNYLRRYLEFASDGLANQGRGAAQANINLSILRSHDVPLPPMEQQTRIAAILDAADALRAKRRKAIAKLDSLTQTIFVDMFGAGEGKKKQLGHLAEVQGGLQVTPKRKSRPISVPYLRVANVYRGALDLSEIKTLQVSEKELTRTRLVTGDLLVVEGHGNKDEIGRVGVWDGSIDPCVHQNHLIRVRCDHNQLLSRFAEAFMNSRDGRRALLQASNTTSGLNTISTNDVREVEITLPALSDQQRFVQVAGCVDRQRAISTTAGAELDTLFASLQQRAFRGEL